MARGTGGSLKPHRASTVVSSEGWDCPTLHAGTAEELGFNSLGGRTRKPLGNARARRPESQTGGRTPRGGRLPGPACPRGISRTGGVSIAGPASAASAAVRLSQAAALPKKSCAWHHFFFTLTIQDFFMDSEARRGLSRLGRLSVARSRLRRPVLGTGAGRLARGSRLGLVPLTL